MAIHKTLVERGHRSTEVRKRIAHWLDSQDGIFTAEDIIQALTPIDKVSVYRTIDLLVKEDIVHTASVIHGQQGYEKHGEEKDHHHHIVCDTCHSSSCVPCDMTRKRVAGFSQVHHEISFRGICQSCI